MATATESTCADQIGDMAGMVWNTLDQHGPLSFAKLSREIDAPRESVALALGWLAREDKIAIEDTGRGKTISLKSDVEPN